MASKLFNFECTCNHGMHVFCVRCVHVHFSLFFVVVHLLFLVISFWLEILARSIRMLANRAHHKLSIQPYKYARNPPATKSSSQTSIQTNKCLCTQTRAIQAHAHSNVNKISINWNHNCNEGISRTVVVSSTKTKGVFYLFKFVFNRQDFYLLK